MADAYPQNLPGTSHLGRSENKTPVALKRSVLPITTDASPSAWRILLYIGTETITLMRIDIDKPQLIGRSDLTENYVPGIDLAHIGAQDMGVSRRHAALLTSADGLYIRDLESTNGTYINGIRLQPHQPFKLRDGDRIELGQLQLKLQIIPPGESNR